MTAISALETEIIRILKESVEIQEKFGAPARIVEAEASRPAFPFIRLMRHDVRDRDPIGLGPVEHRISLEVLSRAGGRAEAGDLLNLIVEALRAEKPAPDGLHVVLFYPVFRDVFLRKDGTSFRGVLRFRALTDPYP